MINTWALYLQHLSTLGIPWWLIRRIMLAPLTRYHPHFT
jgi:hypothetical protein